MKKIVLIFTVLMCLLTSCSFSSESPAAYTPPMVATLEREELPLGANSSIYYAETYVNDGVKIDIVEINGTKTAIPVLPTKELSQQLLLELDSYVTSLDLPFRPRSVDFTLSRSFSIVTYTFYVSDNNKFSDIPYYRFSYNETTCLKPEISDIITVRAFNDIMHQLYTIKDFSSKFTVDAIHANVNGIDIISGDDVYFIDGFYLHNATGMRVFDPDDYEPVKDGETKYVALTFDDGPNPQTTLDLLKMLDNKNVKATFFMVGYNVENYPSVVKAVCDGGHDIGIHSYGHTDYSAMAFNKVEEDLDRCSNLVYSIIEKRPYLVRPPFGSIKTGEIDSSNYFFVNWNVDPLDWKHDSPDIIADEAIKYTKTGSIILLHDIYKSSCDAAEIIIDDLTAKGYRFVTISEYFDLNGKSPDNKLHFYREDYNG